MLCEHGHFVPLRVVRGTESGAVGFVTSGPLHGGRRAPGAGPRQLSNICVSVAGGAGVVGQPVGACRPAAISVRTLPPDICDCARQAFVATGARSCRRACFSTNSGMKSRIGLLANRACAWRIAASTTSGATPGNSWVSLRPISASSVCSVTAIIALQHPPRSPVPSTATGPCCVCIRARNAVTGDTMTP